jgi:hypothetical protein
MSRWWVSEPRAISYPTPLCKQTSLETLDCEDCLRAAGAIFLASDNVEVESIHRCDNQRCVIGKQAGGMCFRAAED